MPGTGSPVVGRLLGSSCLAAFAVVLGLLEPAFAGNTVVPTGVATEPSEDYTTEPTVSDNLDETSAIATEDDAPAPKLATLLVTADADCVLVVGGVSFGALAPELPLEVPVASLEVEIVAVAADLFTARWSELLVLETDEVREISIPMLEAIDAARKKERQEQVFRDIDRGLMWPRRDNAQDVSWAGADEYCEALSLGGFENWQLPSLDELETLEAMWSVRLLKIADQILLSECCVWSSTTDSENRAWNLDFRFRRAFEVSRSLSFGLRALCRRQMAPDELEEARLAADPKEIKRRRKAKELRLEERKRRRETKAGADTPSEPSTS